MSDEDFRDFLTGLSAAGVRHLVVGAYALASHGRVRATGDLDTWIEPTLENAERLNVAIREFAAVSVDYFGVSVEALTKGGVGFYMGVEPDRIDIHTAIAGLTFARAWRGRVAAQTLGVPTEVLGIAELIAAKRPSTAKARAAYEHHGSLRTPTALPCAAADASQASRTVVGPSAAPSSGSSTTPVSRSIFIAAQNRMPKP